MCGITGIVNRDGAPVSGSILEQMTDKIAHRGPDGRGTVIFGQAGLGHRRLSVIDSSNLSAQPMVRGEGRQALSFSGELYNHLEIRKKLESLGVQFTSKGDTEVAYQAIRVWGEKAYLEFNGMFALAWLDNEKRELILTRDRLGIKPLYYADLGRVFLFGSEIKAILEHPAYRTSLNLEAVADYLSFQNVFDNSTLFSNVQSVPPGSFLRVSFNVETNIIRKPYWTLEIPEEDTKTSLSETVEELDVLLRRSVDLQMKGKYLPSVYLSGGIDSAIIASLASEFKPGIDTINIGFEMGRAEVFENDMDESRVAAEIAGILGANHHATVLDVDDSIGPLKDIVWHLEELKMGQCYSNFAAARIAKKSGKTVLSGLGSDELLGGYPWRYASILNCMNRESFLDKVHSYWHMPDSKKHRESLLRPVWSEVRHRDTKMIVEAVFGDIPIVLSGPEDAFKLWRFFELKTFLPGLLHVEDKLGMAHGVETRFPMLDNDVVVYSLSLNISHLIPTDQFLNSNAKPYIENNQGKLLLRQVIKRYLPSPYSERRKRGFTGPNNSWYRLDSGALLKAELYDREAPVYDVLDFKAAQLVLEDHISGRQNHHRLIWSLLSLNQWCKTFF